MRRRGSRMQAKSSLTCPSGSSSGDLRCWWTGCTPEIRLARRHWSRCARSARHRSWWRRWFRSVPAAPTPPRSGPGRTIRRPGAGRRSHRGRTGFGAPGSAPSGWTRQQLTGRQEMASAHAGRAMYNTPLLGGSIWPRYASGIFGLSLRRLHRAGIETPVVTCKGSDAAKFRLLERAGAGPRAPG